jgi:trans-2-enoyl-CoA reductase
MAFAPINPADINMLEGKYVIQPELPCVLGNEGVGIITEVGDEVEHLSIGDHVILPFRHTENWIGTWAETIDTPSSEVIAIPKEIPLKQAAMFTINPVTALQLLTLFCDLEEGDTLVQNAANSGVGRWVIALAKQKGIQTINLVRDKHLEAELKALGATHVLEDHQGVSSEVKKHSDSIMLGLNAVGGQSATEVLKSLSEQGTCVTYGAMSKDPITVSNGQLIYKNIWLTGFNRSKWVQEMPKEAVVDAYNTVIEAYKASPFEIPIDTIYPMAEAEKAIIHAALGDRKGKILFEL